MNKQYARIERSQIEFQQKAGINLLDCEDEEARHLAEMYLFKAVEEIVELRKTFPSGFNKWEKKHRQVDYKEMYRELADVILFLVNFGVLWRISASELLRVIEEVQANNHKLLDQKLEAVHVKEQAENSPDLRR